MQISTQIRTWRNKEQKVDKENKRYYTRMAVLQSLISPWKRKREKRGKKFTKSGIRIWSPIQVLTLSGQVADLVV